MLLALCWGVGVVVVVFWWICLEVVSRFWIRVDMAFLAFAQCCCTS